MVRIARVLFVALSWFCLPLPALAEGTDRAMAEQLFRTGQELMGKGRLNEACPKFAESQRLDPGTGTLLNLAVCHEREGMLASAWAEYNDVVTMAQRDQRPDRVEYARQRLAALEPLLPRLTIELAPGADVPGLEIHLDGRLLGRAALGVAAPMDPGTHRIAATAPGKQPWQSIAEIAATGSDQKPVAPVLRIPPLSARPAGSAKTTPVTPTTHSRMPDSDSSTQRVSAYVLGGIGIVGIAVGSFFGLRAISKNSRSNDQGCVDHLCPAGAADTRREARTAGNLSTVAFVVGGAAMATGAVLYLTLPRQSSETPPSSTRAAVIIAPGISSLGLVSTW